MRELESKALDSFDADPGEDGNVESDFLWQTDMGASAGASIFTFGVFPDDNPIEIIGSDTGEGPLNTWKQAGRANIGVLIEGLADLQAQAPQGDVVRDIGIAS